MAKQKTAVVPTVTTEAKQETVGNIVFNTELLDKMHAKLEKVMPPIDPTLLSVMKEEELLSLYVQTQRGLSKDSESIKQGWITLKKTVTDSNIDELIAFQRLNLLVVSTRTQLGYTPQDIATIWEKTKDKLNPKSVSDTIV